MQEILPVIIVFMALWTTQKLQLEVNCNVIPDLVGLLRVLSVIFSLVYLYFGELQSNTITERIPRYRRIRKRTHLAVPTGQFIKWPPVRMWARSACMSLTLILLNVTIDKQWNCYRKKKKKQSKNNFICLNMIG